MKSKTKALTPEEKLTQALLPREEWPYELPKGWVWTYMGNIAEWGSGGTPSRKHPEYYSGEIPWIKTGELNDSFIYDTSEKITEEAVARSSAKIYPQNTVMIAMYGATIGKTGIMGVEAATNQACACAKVFPFVCFKYLFYYLISKKSYFINSGKGGAQPNISQDFLKRFYFPLPSLSEQQRIVNKIESLFAKLDEAGDRLQKVLDGYEARRAAILHEAFSGKWTGDHGAGEMSVPRGWQATSAKDLFQYVTSGSRGWAKYYSSRGALFIRMGNMKHGTIEPDFTDVQYVALPDKAEGQRSLVQDHDILISITADVGMIGYIDHISQEAYINQHIALARPLHPEQGRFLAWYLVSDKGVQQLQKKKRGATKVGLSLGDIRNLTIYIPPYEEQVKIVNHIETMMEREKMIYDRVQDALVKIDLLKKSILARAFRGELGTQDSSDPSALELLKECVMAGKEVSKS